MAGYKDKFTFKVEWLDQQASLKRYYLLQYYIMQGTNEIELFDIKNRRVFLKRCPFPSLQIKDLFLGAKLTIYGRQMVLVEFGDDYTKRSLGNTNEITFGIIPPAQYRSVGKIIQAGNEAGLTVGKLKRVQLSAADAAKAGYPELAAGPCVALQWVGLNSGSKWGELAKTFTCVASAAEGVEAYSNAFFGARAMESARNTAVCKDCTLAVIKPHAVAAGKLGSLLSELMNSGLEVTAFEMFDIDLVASEEFLEVYKGVVPEYKGYTEELASGRLVAVELVGEDAVHTFRQLCGPRHVDVAGRIAPSTLRAKYGENTIKNAVHCTDLDEDGVLESEYFFRILASV